MKANLSTSLSRDHHRLLRRQLKRPFGNDIVPEGNWAALLKAVSTAYHEADRERRQIETELEANGQELSGANSKLRLLIDDAPAGIVMLDRELRCMFASRRWLQDRRMELENIVGRSHFEIARRWPAAGQRCFPGAWREAQKAAKRKRFRNRTAASTGSNGRFAPGINQRCGCGVIIMSEDITYRKRADEQMRIAAVAFQSRESMIVTDADGIVLQVNQAFCRATGYSAEDAVEQSVLSCPRASKGGPSFATCGKP